MSRSFAANSGSVDSLKVSPRCGCSPKARRTRPTVATERPLALAMERRLPWRAPAWPPGGGRSHRAPSGTAARVRSTRAAACSSPIFRGAPGLGSSSRPPLRSRAKRSRHLPTVGFDTPSSVAIAVLLRPVAARSTAARSAPEGPAPGRFDLVRPMPPTPRVRLPPAPGAMASDQASAPPLQPYAFVANFRSRILRCVILECRGAFSREQEDALWQQVFMAWPVRRRAFEPSSKRATDDPKLGRPLRAEPEDGRQAAEPQLHGRRADGTGEAQEHGADRSRGGECRRVPPSHVATAGRYVGLLARYHSQALAQYPAPLPAVPRNLPTAP